MADPNYITRVGAKRLQDELLRLRTVERPVVVRDVADAAAQGDRSENAEYIYGKRRLREIDRRVRFLSKRLDELTIVNERTRDPSSVFFGAYVTLFDIESERELRYRIVGPGEASTDKGTISVTSPVAKAIIGRSVGDEVQVHAPGGVKTYEISAVGCAP